MMVYQMIEKILQTKKMKSHGSREEGATNVQPGKRRGGCFMLYLLYIVNLISTLLQETKKGAVVVEDHAGDHIGETRGIRKDEG